MNRTHPWMMSYQHKPPDVVVLLMKIKKKAWFFLEDASKVQSISDHPRYLNFFTKGTLFSSPFIVKLVWEVLFSDWAPSTDDGINIASVLDFIFSNPMCIWSPNFSRWSWSCCVHSIHGCIRRENKISHEEMNQMTNLHFVVQWPTKSCITCKQHVQ